MASEGQQHKRSDDKPPPRSGHICATEGDSMFIWGGYNEYIEPWLPLEKYLPGGDVWVYHTLIDRWYCKKTNGDIPSGTSGAAAVICDKALYIVGGHTMVGNSNKVYRLDLYEWKWMRVDSDIDNAHKMSPRDKFAAWEHKNRIYVFGGFGVPISDYLSQHGDFYVDTSTGHWGNPVLGWNNQLLVFDPSTGTWTNPALHTPAPLPRAAHNTVRFDDKIYLFGGRHNNVRLNDLHCLDLNQMRWSRELSVSAEVPKGRSWHSFTKVSSTHAILYGGYTQEGDQLSDGWLLNVTTCQWTQLAVPTNRPRLWHTAAGTPDGDVLVFGGCTNNILSEDLANHTNELFTIQCSVKSLLRICLDVAYKHHDRLQIEWTSLPKHLCHILQLRLEGLSDDNETALGHNTKACCVS